MSKARNSFSTIQSEGALLPPDLLRRISEGKDLDGLTPASYHRPGEGLNEVINRAWNVLQGAWANFRTAQASLPETDLGTRLTRERWLLPLFRELDYGRLQATPAVEIDGRAYPISHTWSGQVPIHLLSYKVDLDRRRQGVAGASRSSPHSLLQVFLNRSQGRWGFVSNGYKLRLLRDNASLTRQAYLEFDLEAMFEGEVYSDFVLLWLVGHQSRLEVDPKLAAEDTGGASEPWLDGWMKAAQTQGTRALDQLRAGVETAITALGRGFLAHPDNAPLRDQLRQGQFSARNYYRQLLRLVYRLLFLFVAEDRELLLDPAADEVAGQRYRQYYATQGLRRLAETFKGTRHADLFVGLRLVMRLLSGEASAAQGAAQGLKPLGSFLFSDRAVAAVIDCQLSNQDLLDAIRALSLTYDEQARLYRRVDYQHLGAAELGSVYESLLELHPQIDVAARHFTLSTAGGHERKTTGSYYTPESLVNALLDSALEPVLAAAVKQGEAAILALKICDPACGSGHFLIAAANRLAKALAFVRTGEEEPPPAAIQSAKRDIIGHCIYGVDLNPMAVELCKVSLWMEAMEPGKPLSFLDHHIQVGNSLLGTTPRLMAEGIPDGAFKPLEGDDKQSVASLKKRNKTERQERAQGARQGTFFELPVRADYDYLGAAFQTLNTLPNEDLPEVQRQEAHYTALAQDPEYVKVCLLADAWCAAFVWEKKPSAQTAMLSKAKHWLPLTDRLYRQMEEDPQAPHLQVIREQVVALTDRYRFFHWHVAFPDVFRVPDPISQAEHKQMGWDGGFDVVLGNPPWEHIEIKEKEWFAERVSEIANASSTKRKALIANLEEADPYLYQAFIADKRIADGFSHFVRTSENYPLTGRGRINTYPLFSEKSRHITNSYGRVGMIVPSGIATDDTTKFFFQDLMQSRSLASLYDFENRDGIFSEVHRSYKFSLITMTGWQARTRKAEFVFFAHQVADLQAAGRRFTLSAQEIAALNPNTGTMATFRSQKDAEITKSIYQSVPVLIREQPAENLWNIVFKQGFFNMSSDSDKFHTRQDLENAGYKLEGNHFGRGKERYLPLYEAKLIHQFTHRWATYEADGSTRDMTLDELRNPSVLPLPRYWVNAKDIFAYRYLIGFRRVARTTDERTFISTLLSHYAIGDSIFLIGFQNYNLPLFGLSANFNSLPFDFVVRQKLGGMNASFFYVQQLSVIPPHTYTPTLLDFIVPRVLELTYTAWDLQAFAQDLGYAGPPFLWDEERRFLLRCELDALYFHLYQIRREEVDYIMETFPIVKRKDEAAHGGYRTKAVILAMYDQMAALPSLTVPAPKDAGEGYAVPDVGGWMTWLEPPPADERVAH